MVFGLNALVTKPAISIAPMITVALLSRYGYSSTSATLPGVVSTTVSSTDSDLLMDAMFFTTCAVPLVTGLLQLFFWRFYTIRDSHKASYVLPVMA